MHLEIVNTVSYSHFLNNIIYRIFRSSSSSSYDTLFYSVSLSIKGLEGWALRVSDLNVDADVDEIQHSHIGPHKDDTAACHL